MELASAINRLYRRLLLVVGRGQVTTSDDSGNVQTLQVQLGPMETRDNTPRLAEFGLASNPPHGSDAIVIFVGGDRSNGVVIATGNKTLRMKSLAPGESAIYDSLGKYVYLSASGIIVEAKGQPVTVNDASDVTVNASGTVTIAAPNTKITGTLEVDGNVTMKGTCAATGAITSSTSVADPTGTMQAMRTIYDGHTHTVNGVTSSTPSQAM